MSENGIRFDRSDLQRVMKNKGIEIEAEEKKKEPQSTGMRVRNRDRIRFCVNDSVRQYDIALIRPK